MKNTYLRFMQEALKQARIGYDNGEVPIGAVIVYQNKIIAKSHNQVELLKDPTAHAEILAITQATSYLRCKWLEECTLYVTVEPCIMCAAALVFSRIGKVVFGAYDSKGGGLISKVDINRLKLNYKIKFKGGILEKECAKVIKDFFQKKRELVKTSNKKM
ncbi:MAG: hypothetical protein DRP68_07340 [Candidatus Omnitrophota bacterium]|nr:MAG: hypothetical protein DRP68_07340 [Candidatus Omnitrophota bacterium]HDN85805.1 nucleoside deaminase [Candidatus Omnitrophota bacterium]